ncbi:MAG: hypothetical protein ACYC91_07710 [Solirubrobacteraceae bacterium]
MELLDQDAAQALAMLAPHERTQTCPDEREARRTLRGQIAKLERELADAFVTAFPMGGIGHPEARSQGPRLLSLGELEQARDELVARLRAARVSIAERADVQEAKRLQLERMLLEPARYPFQRVALSDIGEPGCGVWEVRPRMGLIGMLRGWWQIKLSSGCPLPRGHGLGP